MMVGNDANSLLAKAEAALVAKVPAQLKGDLQKVLSAGMQILYAPQLQGKLEQKLVSTDPVQAAAQGSVNLMAELWKQSRFSIPKPLVVPSMLLFAFEYLDLAERAGKAQVTPAMIAQTTKLATDKLQALAGAQGAQGAGQPQAPQPTAQPVQPQQPAGIIAAAQGAP